MVAADLERVRDKSTIRTAGHLGADPSWAILRSIVMGYRCKVYCIPSLDGLKGEARLAAINSWGVSKHVFDANDWKNCGRESYQTKMLSYEYVKKYLDKIKACPINHA